MSATAAHPGTAPIRRFPLPRLGLAAGLVALAVALLAFHHALRVGEARLATPLLEWTTGHPALAVSGEPLVLVGLGTSWSSALEVSVMCSAAVLFVPIVVVSAVLALPSQIEVGRLLTALGVCALAVLATNTLRILVIALSMEQWGAGRGYVLAHDTLGTFVSLVGVGIALLLFVRLTVGRISRPNGAARSATGHRRG